MYSFDVSDRSVSMTVDGQRVDAGIVAMEPPVDEDLPNVITLRNDTGEAVGYQFSVDGELARSRANGATVDVDDLLLTPRGAATTRGTTVYGRAGGGPESYRFSGALTSFDVDDAAVDVVLNGRRVDAADLIEEPAVRDDLPHVLSISGGDPAEPLRYQFEVSGSVVRTDANGASIDPGDFTLGGTAYGRTLGGTDSFAFDGSVTAFRSNLDADVTVDGSSVDDPVGSP